jgi:hypothetical protein
VKKNRFSFKGVSLRETQKQKRLAFLFGVLALVLILGAALTACGGKKDSGGGGSGDIGDIANAARTAGDAARALESVSGGSGGGKARGTVSKAEDFKYDLTADGKGVIIQKILTDGAALKFPAEIEGYPVVELGAFGGYGPWSFTSIEIPDSVTKFVYDLKMMGMMSSFSVGSFKYVEKIKLSKNLTEIPAFAFDNCTALTTITIPEGVTRIGRGAFVSCESLKEITIPASVTEIGPFAFSGCSELAKVTLPSHPIQYGTDGDPTFKNCPKLSLAVRKAITDSGYTGNF